MMGRLTIFFSTFLHEIPLEYVIRRCPVKFWAQIIKRPILATPTMSGGYTIGSNSDPWVIIMVYDGVSNKKKLGI